MTSASEEYRDIETVIVSFVDKKHRRRLLELLERPNRRRDLKDMLWHFDRFDMQCVVPVPPSEQKPDSILRILKGYGAGSEVTIISADVRLDQQRLPLGDALNLVVGSDSGSIVSCIPGKLAYYEGEDRGTRHILTNQGERDVPDAGKLK
jgi:hypothetical protein